MMLNQGKGMGAVKQLAQNGWDILKEEVSLPIAVLEKSALVNNAKWMANFAKLNGVSLAPHGKTTMAPALFQLQLEHGAWGITVATVPQLAVAVEAGAKRIILANQLVGRFHFAQVKQLLTQRDIELYCFVDSQANARELGAFFVGCANKLNVLLEVGIAQGRCGCQSYAELMDLAHCCSQYDGLAVAGIGFYEGVIHGSEAEQQVAQFVAEALQQAVALHQQGYFSVTKPVITGAGSAWYDIVTAVWQEKAAELPFHCVIRPGCYLIHDTGIYQQAQDKISRRSQAAQTIMGELRSSLFIWAYVLSLPEPGRAIIGMGKRDVAFDAGLPTPEWAYSPKQQQLHKVDDAWTLTAIMDQHAVMIIPKGARLDVGDMMCFSTSHPCLTFDKWKHIAIVEQPWVVNELVTTQF